MQPNIYSILVVDDHPIIHDGLRTLLANEHDLEIVTTATSAREALQKLKGSLPDLAIIDLSLGDSDGSYLIQRIRTKHPKLRILIYTMSEEKLFAERLASAGANGYIMKTSPPSMLKQAIRSVLADEMYFPEDILRRIQKSSNGRSEGPLSPLDSLSNREMDIFKLIGQGLDAANIARKLKITRNTVDTHRINIKNKLELKNGKALDRYSFEVIQQGKLPKKK
ncbi:response regulator transcription factor [Pontiella sulfatireligans]|uniref:Oxygen regulatory protein NreC n=1 Tax=Pontiella sulfatireligans TaxID=2750658 RepID=A0A6C2UIS8_9BACT|nr:response regulator transcription factor [Pontiella sulfatireligans]VGO20018.1 Oxygen regulatory protein NreC [Pontiella sulfatireligans]